MKQGSAALVKVTIILMMMLPLFSIDIYLPAFPNLKIYFATTEANVQATLSFFLLGYGIAHLIYAPIVERLGSKKTLLLGFFIYVIFTFSALFASSIHTLLLFRIAQGMGACAGSMIGRLLIMEIYQENSAKAFASVYPFVGTSPIIAPLVGGYIMHYLGNWVYTFVALLVFSGSTLGLISKYIPVSHAELTEKRRPDFGELCIGYLRVLKNREYWRYASLFIGQYQIWFIYIMETPFIFHHIGLTSKEIGYCYIPLSMTFFVFNHVVKKLLSRYSSDQLLFCGLVFLAIGCLLWLVPIKLSGGAQAVRVILPMIIVMVGCSALAPLGTLGALAAVPQERSYGSAFLGFMQLILGAIFTFLISRLFSDAYQALMFFSVLMTLVMFLFFVPKRKKNLSGT